MASIISHRKRPDKNDLIDMRLIEKAYGSDYSNKGMVHSLEMNTYVDPTMVSKTMVPSIDLEDGLRHLGDNHLTD